MALLPVRNSLVTQTADIIRSEIQQGTWSEWLPSERALCEKYQVSRNTIRAAIERLKRDRLVRPAHGSGNQILAPSDGKKAKTKIRDIALLAPVGLERLRPAQAIMIDELRALLGEYGCRLHAFHGAQYFRANPGDALKKLLAQNPHSCWILLRSNESVQKWFSENYERCIVAGSVHTGLNLAYRDLDHRAICRHAAGMLLMRGHTKIALVLSKPSMAGDLESEAGMAEALQQSNHPDAGIVTCHHDGTVADIGIALRRLMSLRLAPTALLVANAYHYLTVAGHLTQMGLRVPEDISVISRDDDVFLSYLVPAPTRYVTDPRAFARLLERAALEISDSGHVTQQEIKLMPEFVRGGSIGSRSVVP